MYPTTRRTSDFSFRLLLLLGVGVVLGWAAWSMLGLSSALPTQPGGAPLRVGAILALTGPTSFLGDPARKTLVALAGQINAQGGIRGRPLEIVVHDSQGEVGTAVQSARALASDPTILAVVGPSLASEAAAIMPVLQEARLPLISIASGGTPVRPVPPWTFQVTHNDSQSVGCILDYLSSRQIREMALLTADDAFGASGAEQVLEQCGDRGFPVVLQERYPVGDPDAAHLTAFLARVRRSRAEALIVWGPPPGPSLVTRLAREAKLPQALVLCPSGASREFLRQTGTASEGVLFSASPLLVCEALPQANPQRAVLLHYKRWFETTYHSDASPFGGQAWDAMQLLSEALSAVGPERAKIRAWLEETRDFIGTTGTFRFSSSDHEGLDSESLVMVRVEKGRWRLVQ